LALNFLWFVEAQTDPTQLIGVQKAADRAMRAGSMLYTDSASNYRLITGYAHDSGNHTKKDYAQGDVHENRAERYELSGQI
jgi:ISXO2-like transposase domain